MIASTSYDNSAAEMDQEMRSLLIFELDRQAFALDIACVVQIIPMIQLTPVPQVDRIIEGIANIHGTMIPVMSVRRYLGLPELELGLYTPIILAKAGERQVGLIVDQVSDVISIPQKVVSAPGEILPEGMENAAVICGLLYWQNCSVLVLDTRYLLRPSQFTKITRAVQEQAVKEEPSESLINHQVFDQIRAGMDEKREEIQAANLKISQQPAEDMILPAPASESGAPSPEGAPTQAAPEISTPVVVEPPLKAKKSTRRSKPKQDIIPTTAPPRAEQRPQRGRSKQALMARRIAELTHHVLEAESESEDGSALSQPPQEKA